jgi:hypothetical protein
VSKKIILFRIKIFKFKNQYKNEDKLNIIILNKMPIWMKDEECEIQNR